MAMTREEYMQLLEKISETGGFTENMLDDLQRLRDDFDEREGELQRYKETADRTVYTDDDVMDADGVRWSEKYGNMVKRYKARFFGSFAEAKEEQVEDVREDDKSTFKTFDELFSDREGDYK